MSILSNKFLNQEAAKDNCIMLFLYNLANPTSILFAKLSITPNTITSLSILLSEQLIVKKIGDDYKKPVYLTAANNQSDTLYVVEQRGRIQTIIQGQTVDPLLDIQARVHQPRMPGDERGLLGMALHPDFRNNGKFYVNYVNHDDTTIISTFTLQDGHLTARSEEVIMRIKQPYSNLSLEFTACPNSSLLYLVMLDKTSIQPQ